jgi:CheY-like chemotaxis protein
MRVVLARAERAEDEPGSHQAAPAVPAGSSRRTILYIEDNLSNLKLVERLVQRLPGVRLIPAMQAKLGVELAREHHPDLILLDLHLPDLHGGEALARLKSDPDTASIPVVVLSADATPGQVGVLMQAGAADYLTKPLDIELLLETVARTLQADTPGLRQPQAAR